MLNNKEFHDIDIAIHIFLQRYVIKLHLLE